MIASTPVGSWTWDLDLRSAPGDPLVRSAYAASLVRDVLAEYGMAVGASTARVTTRAEGDANTVLFDRQGLLVAPPPAKIETELLPTLREALDSGDMGIASVRLTCGGAWQEQGEQLFAEKFSTLVADVWASGAGTLTVSTFADVWLTRDLRGRAQPEVHAQNAPRLEAALRRISDIAGTEPDPGDPTWYATPSDTGFAAVPDDDPELLDAWDMFEVPTRRKRLLSGVPSCSTGYASEADTPIRYMAVATGGRVLGYLWAADAEDAAGYEPRNAAGDAAFDAGVVWLTRLTEARYKQMSPLEALAELARLPADPQAGQAVLGSEHEAPSLETLQELSGRR